MVVDMTNISQHFSKSSPVRRWRTYVESDPRVAPTTLNPVYLIFNGNTSGHPVGSFGVNTPFSSGGLMYPKLYDNLNVLEVAASDVFEVGMLGAAETGSARVSF